MNNTDFFKLSESKVEELNGCKDEKANEAWRNGYNYLKDKLRDMMETCYAEEVLSKIEDLCEDELEDFKWNVY